jgi:hypothetical protein
MRSLGSYKHEVALPQQELDLIDGPVLHEDLYITHELRDAVTGAGFVPDAKIPSKVLLASTVVAADVKGLATVALSLDDIFRRSRQPLLVDRGRQMLGCAHHTSSTTASLRRSIAIRACDHARQLGYGKPPCSQADQ